MNNINTQSFINNVSSQQQKKQAIQSFYNQFGIKQYSCFSGGFKYRQKQNPKITQQNQHKQLGIAKNKNKLDFYKIENDYVPQTKSQLADKLVQKLQHQMKKLRYYRQKYVGYEKPT